MNNIYSNLLNNFVIGNIDNYGVNGKAGVEVFPTQPNQRYALFDKEDDIIYFLGTDANNIKSSIRRVRFSDEPEPEPESLYASKKEIEELKGEINNVQQSIQQLIELQQSANSRSENSGSRSQYKSNGRQVSTVSSDKGSSNSD